MKKILSIILVVVIAFSCFTITASAVCGHKLSCRMVYIYYDSFGHIARAIYYCDICNLTYNYEDHIAVHRDTNGDKYCDYCGAVYVGGSGGSGGSGGGSSSCSHSSSVFAYYDYTCSDSSNKYHLVTTFRKCRSCGATFPDISSMSMEHHYDTNGDKKCDLCGINGMSCDHFYTSTTEYEYYDLSFHKVNNIGTCQFCKDKKTESDIKPHTDENQDKICDNCGYKDIVLVTDSSATPCSHTGDTLAYTQYEQPNDLKKHTTVTHSTCTLCNNAYISKVYDEYHKDRDKDSVCDICSVIVEHTEHYDEDKNDECDFCDKILKTHQHILVENVNYKENALIKVNADNLPEGARIAIYESYVSLSSWEEIATSTDSNFEWESRPLKDRAYFMIKIIDENGNTIIDSSKTDSYIIVVNVEDTFGLRIKAFFRRLFGKDMTNEIGTYQFNF